MLPNARGSTVSGADGYDQCWATNCCARRTPSHGSGFGAPNWISPGCSTAGPQQEEARGRGAGVTLFSASSQNLPWKEQYGFSPDAG